MTPDLDLELARRFYAEEIRAVAHLSSEPLVAAYARVPREAFLSPGPWRIARPFDVDTPYRTTPDANPLHVHHDVVVAIDPERMLNNGQPTALARWIESVDPRPGDAVLHVGCGTGYYTAILAETVGARGRVAAYEIDAELAARASANLAPWPHVTVAAGDGGAIDGTFHVIFVNAGATHPRAEWLRALAPGGRMFIPLTVHMPQFPHGVGLAMRIERPADAAADRWSVRVVTQVGIYDCAGARDPEVEQQLPALLGPMTAGGKAFTLVTSPHDRGAGCLVHAAASCLQAG